MVFHKEICPNVKIIVTPHLKISDFHETGYIGIFL